WPYALLPEPGRLAKRHDALRVCERYWLRQELPPLRRQRRQHRRSSWPPLPRPLLLPPQSPQYSHRLQVMGTKKQVVPPPGRLVAPRPSIPADLLEELLQPVRAETPAPRFQAVMITASLEVLPQSTMVDSLEKSPLEVMLKPGQSGAPLPLILVVPLAPLLRGEQVPGPPGAPLQAGWLRGELEILLLFAGLIGSLGVALRPGWLPVWLEVLQTRWPASPVFQLPGRRVRLSAQPRGPHRLRPLSVIVPVPDDGPNSFALNGWQLLMRGP